MSNYEVQKNVKKEATGKRLLAYVSRIASSKKSKEVNKK